jgi:hypothetical protein
MFVEWFKNHRPKDYEYILNFYKNFKKSWKKFVDFDSN